MTRQILAVFAIITTLGLALLAPNAASGQATGGQLKGTVADANGAAVPNATVTVHREETGQVVSAQTGEGGAFVFPNLAVGVYTLTAEADGFRPAAAEARVALNRETALDLRLEVAGVEEAVEVRAAAEPVVQTDSSQTARSFEARRVLNLPLSGDQNRLALLAPNVVEQSPGVPGAGGAVGGTRPRGNSFNVDGIDNNDPTVTGPSARVIQDAVEEFTLLQNNYNAEYGAGAGGQFNTVTKSGTNEYHGSLFGYAQSQRLNAASTNEERRLRAGEIDGLPLYKRARYGATFGGPAVKNRLFFFGAFERDFTDQAGSALAAPFYAPTAAGLEQIARLPGVSPYVVGLLRENLTLAPAASPEATAAFGDLLGATGVPFGLVTPGVAAGSRDTLAQLSVEHLPDERNQFRYRFNSQRVRGEEPGTGGERFNNLRAFDMRLFSATWVRTLGASTVNDLRVAYRRVVEDYPLKDSALEALPNIVTPAFAFGPKEVLPQGSPVNNLYQVYDSVTHQRGAHTLKAGAEYRRLIFSTNFVQYARGYYDYAGLEQLLRDEAPSTQIRGVGRLTFTGNREEVFGFAQDDWRVTDALTLNLGLRYEYGTLPRDLAAQELNAAASVPGVLEFRRPRTDRNNFAPRVGLAYSPRAARGPARLLFGEGAGALRANFGVSYYEPFVNLYVTSLPPQFQQTSIVSNGAGAGFLEGGGTPDVLTPFATPAQARAATGAYIPDQTTPYSMAWTLSYQRELPGRAVLELRYLGTRGRHLPVQLQLNAGGVQEENLVLPTFLAEPSAGQLAGLPTLGQVKARPGMNTRRLVPYGFAADKALTSYQYAGASQYDGGSVSLTRAAGRGLAFTAAYTWSKTIDDSTVELNSSLVNPRRPQDFLDLADERGASALDIPHRFAAGFDYELPFFRGARPGALRALLGGFRLAGIFSAQSGQPVTPLSNVDSNLNLDRVSDRTIVNVGGAPGTSSAVRAVNAAGQPVAVGSNAAVAYVALDPSAQYIQAGPGARANAGRNTLRTRGFNRTDLSLLKDFRFGEGRFAVQAGAEAYNLFNQRIRTLAGFGNLAESGGPGQRFVTAGGLNFNDYGLGNYGGRTVQLRAKLIF